MTTMYKCGLCGKKIETLDEYLRHTQLCVKEQKIKEEDVQKMNDDLNRVKAAKEYFEQQLAEFKANHPIAYNLNFKEKTCNCNTCACEEEKQHEPVRKTLSFEKNGNEYKVNGKKMTEEELLKTSDDFVQAVCQLLGLEKTK